MAIEYHLDEVEYALMGLDEQVTVLSGLSEDGLGAWWNPVDWAKGGIDAMQAAKDAAEILKSVYTMLREIYAQSQASYMEILSWWRGLVGETKDIEGRMTSLKNEKGSREKYWDDLIGKAKDSQSKQHLTNQKKAEISSYSSQILGYQSVLDNIKKMWEGMWGKGSPFGKFTAGIELFGKGITSSFTNFQKQFEVFGKGFAKSFTDYVKQFDQWGKGLGKSLCDFTKSFDGYVIEFKKAIDGVAGALKNVETATAGTSKQIAEQVNKMSQFLNVQNLQIKEMQNINVDARKFYESGAQFFKDATAHLKNIDTKLSILGQ